jgi:hypothetical protein
VRLVAEVVAEIVMEAQDKQDSQGILSASTYELRDPFGAGKRLLYAADSVLSSVVDVLLLKLELEVPAGISAAYQIWHCSEADEEVLATAVLLPFGRFLRDNAKFHGYCELVHISEAQTPEHGQEQLKPEPIRFPQENTIQWDDCLQLITKLVKENTDGKACTGRGLNGCVALACFEHIENPEQVHWAWREEKFGGSLPRLLLFFGPFLKDEIQNTLDQGGIWPWRNIDLLRSQLRAIHSGLVVKLQYSA